MLDPINPQDPNVQSASYFVARADARCWHCGRFTCVVALALPRHHETLESDEPEAEPAWQPSSANAFLFHVSHLPEPVAQKLRQLCAGYRLAYSEVTLSVHWANHCEHCERLLGDDELHCEPGIFMPASQADAESIELFRIEEPIAAIAAGYALEPEYFPFMRKVSGRWPSIS
jgi:hypothetical protein